MIQDKQFKRLEETHYDLANTIKSVLGDLENNNTTIDVACEDIAQEFNVTLEHICRRCANS